MKPPVPLFWRASALLFLLNLFIFALAEKALAEGSPPVISKITIYSTDIFDLETKPYLKKVPYTWINSLHLQTHKYIIEQELLFKVGDPYDPFKVNETERNLRALSFIRAARVSQFPQPDGTVALVVFASDSWTTEPQLNLSGNNAIDELEIGFKEKNFLGLGKTFEISYTDADDGTDTTFRYSDPRLLRSRWSLTAEYVDKNDGAERGINLIRPFFSAGSKWSSGFSHRRNEEEIDVLENNIKVSGFDKTSELGEIFGGVKVGGGLNLVHRAGLRYRKRLERFAPSGETAANRPIPRPQDFQTVFVDWSTIHNNFLELTRIEKMTRVEDFNLGPEINVSPGMSPKFLTGGRDVTEMEGNISQKIYLPSEIFITGRFSYRGQDVVRTSINELYLADTRFYYLGFPKQTIVAHIRAEWGDSLDTENSIRLGSQEGLRAYSTDEVFGSKSLLINLENRLFFIDDLFDLVSIGGVIYYDGGFAWSSGQPVAMSDLLQDVGVGFRFGMTKSSNELIARLDFSLRITNSSKDNDEFVISFGSGQAF